MLEGAVAGDGGVGHVVDGGLGPLGGQVGGALGRGVAQGQRAEVRMGPHVRRHAVATATQAGRVLRLGGGGSAGSVLQRERRTEEDVMSRASA